MNKSQEPTTSTNTSVVASSRGTVLVVVESCIFLALDLTALVGNTLVCVALYRNISLRTVTNNFILSLALTDLLMAVLVMPLIASASLADEWIGGSFGLAIYGYGNYFLGRTSMLTVMLLAINRYFRVVKPTLYRNTYTKKSSAVIAVTAWIVSAVVACVAWSVLGLEFRRSSAYPTIILHVFPSTREFRIDVAVRGFLIAVAGLVIVSCYVKIYQTIRHHNTAAAPSSQEGHSSYGVEEAKITRILTVVLIGFYFCWLTPFITFTLDSLTLIGESSHKYENFFSTFPLMVSSVINPLIYATMSRPFKMEFLKILRG